VFPGSERAPKDPNKGLWARNRPRRRLLAGRGPDIARSTSCMACPRRCLACLRRCLGCQRRCVASL